MNRKLRTIVAALLLACLVITEMPAALPPVVGGGLAALAEAVFSTLDARPVTDVMEANGWQYRLCADGDAVLTGRSTPGAASLRVPAKLNGAWVTRIGAGAFSDCAALLRLEIPARVSEIAFDALPASSPVTIAAPNGSSAARYAGARGLRLEKTSRYDFFDNVLDLSELRDGEWQLRGSQLELSAPYARQMARGRRLFLPANGAFYSGVAVQVLSIDGGRATVELLGFAESVRSYRVENQAMHVDYSGIELLMPGVTLADAPSGESVVYAKAIQPTYVTKDTLRFDMDVDLPNDFKLSGSISQSFKTTSTAEYDDKNIQKLVIDETKTNQWNVSIKKTFGRISESFINTSKNDEPLMIPFARVPLIGDLVHINLELKLVIALSGEISITQEVTTKQRITYYDGTVTKEIHPEDTTRHIDANVSFKAELSASLTCMIGFDAGKTYLKIAELKAALTFKVDVDYSPRSPVCLDLGIKASFSVSLDVGILEVKLIGHDLISGKKFADDVPVPALAYSKVIYEADIAPPENVLTHFEIPEGRFVEKCTHDDGQYARVTLCATFTESYEIAVKRGETVDSQPTPVRDGYYFNGWYTSVNFKNDERWFFGRNIVDDDITLYAKWTDARTGKVLKPDDLDVTFAGAEALEYEVRTDDDGNDYIAVTGVVQEVMALRIPGMIDGIPVKTICSDAFNKGYTVNPEAHWSNQKYVKYCHDMRYLEIGEGVENLTWGCIEGSHLQRVKLPASLKNTDRPFNGNCDELVEVTLAEGMVTVPEELFYGLDHSIAVVFPETLREIGEGAFSGTPFTHLTLPKGLERIADSAFSRSKLESVSLPETLKEIGEWAFAYTPLTDVALPEGLERIGSGAFSDTKLHKIRIPASVKSIGGEAFGIETLEEVELPATLGDIVLEPGYSMGSPFGLSCKNLTRVAIPDGATAIPDCFFYEATALEEVELPESLERIGSMAFYRAAIREIKLPEGLKQLWGFDDCQNLESITVPAGVEKIGGFSRCDNLKRVVFSEGMTVVPEFAFYDARFVEEIVLPGTLKTIEGGVLSYAPIQRVVFPASLERINGGSPVTLGSLCAEAVFLNPDTVPNSNLIMGLERVYCYEGGELDKYIAWLRETGYCEKLQIIYLPKDYYTVTWNTMEAGVELPLTYAQEDALIAEPAVAAKDDSVLEGWYLDPAFTQRWSFASDRMPSRHITLYARWIADAERIVYSVSGGKATVRGFNGRSARMVVPETLGGATVTALSANAIPGGVRQLILPETLTSVDANAFRFASALTSIEVSCKAAWKSGDSGFHSEDGVLLRGDALVCLPQGRAGAEYAAPDYVKSLSTNAVMFNDSLEKLSLPGGVKLAADAVHSCPSLVRVSFAADASRVDSGNLLACADSLTLVCAKSAPVLRAYAEAYRLDFNRFTLGCISNGTWYCAMRLAAGEALPEMIPEAAEGKCFIGWSDEGYDGALFTGVMPMEDLILFAVFADAYDTRAVSGGVELIRYNGRDTAPVVPDAIGGAKVVRVASGCFGTSVVALRGNPGGISEKTAMALGLSFEALTYALNYQSNGGTHCPGAVLRAGDAIALPAPIRDSYEFVGWYEDAALTAAWTGDRMPGRDLTLYARWRRVDEETYVPFTFEDEGGSLVITGYTGNSDTVVIPDAINGQPVVAIGAYALASDALLREVEVSAGIRELREGAFSGSRVNTVRLKGAKVVGSFAFADCRDLSVIEMADGLQEIGEYAFAGCGNMLKAAIPDSVSQLGEGAFSMCVWLAELHLPEALTAIPDLAFMGCKNIKAVTIPKGVEQIAPDAFASCAALTAFDAEAGGAFSAEDGVLFAAGGARLALVPAGRADEAYRVPDGVTEIGPEAMKGCRVRELTLGCDVTVVGEGALSHAALLERVTFEGEGLQEIGDQAFDGCRNLRALALPQSVTRVGNEVLRTSGIEQIDIPAGAALGRDALPEGGGVTVRSTAGSPAQAYAEAHGNRFVNLAGDVQVTGITLSPATLNLAAGQSAPLTAALTPSNTTERAVVWESSDPAVAYVDESGTVYARSAGEAVVRATARNGASDACAVTVTASQTGVAASALQLSRGDFSVQVNSFQAVSATLLPANARPEAIAWSTGDPEIAVWMNGLVLGLQEGSTTLTATTESGLTASCTVTVQAEPVPVNPGMILKLPADVTDIEDEAFEGVKIARVCLPYGVRTIGARAFANGGRLREVYIPDTIEWIDPAAFGDSLSRLTIYCDSYDADNAATRFAKQYGAKLKYYYFYSGYEEDMED